MQRSMTPQSQPAPGFGGSAGYQAAPRSGFMSGLMGGLIGAGIGGLLFGHGFMGGGMGGFGFIGLLLQIFLLVIVVRFIFRLVTNGRSSGAGGRSEHLRPQRDGGFGCRSNAGRRLRRGGPPPITIRPGGLPAVRAVAAGRAGGLDGA